MRLSRWIGFVALAMSFSVGAVRAETKVEMKNVHLCCGACIAAVNRTLKTVEGVQGVSDQKAKTVTLTAADTATLQKAVDALVDAGFHGVVESKEITIKDDSGVEKGKVKSLTLTGVHNCCRQCNVAIKGALSKVEGVTGDTAKANAKEFEVTGDFDAQAAVKALFDAGFHVKVKK